MCVSLCRDKVLPWHGKCDVSRVVYATILSKLAQSREGPGYENRALQISSGAAYSNTSSHNGEEAVSPRSTHPVIQDNFLYF